MTSRLTGSKNPRYKPCDCLLRVGIPCKIWGEDVLFYHGVPTLVFDLFILVSDPEASRQLVSHGYIRTTPNKRFIKIPELSSQAPRLVLAEKIMEIPSMTSDATGLLQADDTVLPGVVLLSATEWNYSLPHSLADLQELIPSLHEYFDSIVEKWMDLTANMHSLRRYLAIHIHYHSVYLDEFWTKEFENEIRLEHRQLLFDIMADGAGGNVDLLDRECQIYHQSIRNQILEKKV
ncbi:hypothetical protein N7495_004265 [Penicillium taxi]|uniref:uncharacterized protein n=1 Tax=Penicillium taxi TaxID=168475 RepID=UPI002545BCAF|nr:uncharacterized protein N7495_004265 [Penicillium taxi]KAJ5899521.1 hypothetical protein N7495_004265 [Penicillium taxi]